MRLVLVGCEYTGKTTLANEIAKWKDCTMGPVIPENMPPFHDHFTFPHVSHGEFTDEECEKIWAVVPRLGAMIQNHQILYHIQSTFFRDHDNFLVGFHFDEAVYSPLYYGYGGGGLSSLIARSIESSIMRDFPDTVLVMLKASTDVIRKRMRENPHHWGLLKEKDIECVQGRFDEEYASTLLRYRFTLDTSTATVEETLADFVTKMVPHLRESDRMRIQTHRPSVEAG